MQHGSAQSNSHILDRFADEIKSTHERSKVRRAADAMFLLLTRSFSGALCFVARIYSRPGQLTFDARGRVCSGCTITIGAHTRRANLTDSERTPWCDSRKSCWLWFYKIPTKTRQQLTHDLSFAVKRIRIARLNRHIKKHHSSPSNTTGLLTDAFYKKAFRWGGARKAAATPTFLQRKTA